MIIGAHCSISGGLCEAVNKVLSYGGNCMQICLRAPQQIYHKRFDNGKLLDMKKKIEEHNIILTIHSSYTINFARYTTDKLCVTGRLGLLNNLQDASVLGTNCLGCVIHMGKALTLDQEIARNNYIENIKECIAEMKKKNINSKIILETGASVGSEICSKIEGLASIYSSFDEEHKKYLGICIDTAHIFATGYDISTECGTIDFYNVVKENIGWENITCVHLNDSYIEKCGIHRDLHACIPYGTIGINIGYFVMICRVHNIPMILETPGCLKKNKEIIKYINHKEEIDTIKSWFKRSDITT